MKNCAIICEYNPMHTGHLYQLQKASRTFDSVICVMSGNFVQRAEPAITSKAVRTTAALSCGADMVIELPVIYATANGEHFARGAVETISSLSDISSIVMGCETKNTVALQKIAELQYDSPNDFLNLLHKYLDDGNSYAKALSTATAACIKKFNKDEITDILSTPNNLLCIEYIKAIYSTGKKITPTFIHRKGNNYNNYSFSGDYISATALRELLKDHRYTEASAYLAGNPDAIINEHIAHPTDYALYEQLSIFALRLSSPEKLRQTFDAGEGIEFKLYENALKFTSLSDVISATKSKRYTYGRLRRIILQNLLGITKDALTPPIPIPPLVLGIKETFKPYLSDNVGKLIVRNSDYAMYDEQLSAYFEIEKKAENIFSQISGRNNASYRTHKLISM